MLLCVTRANVHNRLTSRLMDPLKALGKAGMLGNFLNNFDGGVEVLDDLDDHWTAKNHKDERRFIIEDLQDLAADKSVRVTILSGDVHLAAIGQFYSNSKLQLPKHKDFRYMPNIISSAIANTPPPDLVADILNKRNKVHHFDKETDEDMIPIFTQGVDGKPRNNQRLLPHRNWCSIRPYEVGYTPPPTPPSQSDDSEDDESPRPGLFRRLSLSKSRATITRADMPQDRSRPPITGSGGGLLRSLSRRASTSEPNVPGQGKPKRSLSFSRGSGSIRRLFRRSSYDSRAEDESSNGEYADESVDNLYYDDYDRDGPQDSRQPPRQNQQPPSGRHPIGLRGGGGHSSEYVPGDDSYFTARPPRRAFTQPSAARHGPHGDNYEDYSPEDSDEGTPPPVHARSRRAQELQDERAQTGQNSGRSPMMTAASATAAARRGLGEPGQQQYRQQQQRPPSQSQVSHGQFSHGSDADFRPKTFQRTPTGLSAKLIKKAGGPERVAVDLDGGLEITLNVEVNPKDPAGITVPYRLIVPKLWSDSVAGGGRIQSPEVVAQTSARPLPHPPQQTHQAQAQQAQHMQQAHQEGQVDYDDEYSDFSDDQSHDGRGRFSPQDKQQQSRPPASGGGLGSGIKRWLSNRSSNNGSGGEGGGGGSQYRSRRGGNDGAGDSTWNDGSRM